MRLSAAHRLSVFILVLVVLASTSFSYAPDRCRCSDGDAGWSELFLSPPAAFCACCSDVCLPVPSCRKAECSHRAQAGSYSVITDTRRMQQKETGVREAVEACNTSGAAAFPARILPVSRIGIPSVPRQITTTRLLI